MADIVLTRETSATTEDLVARTILILVSVIFFALFIVLPLIVIFTEAFNSGMTPFISAISDSDAISAIELTLLIAAISVPLNLVFGVSVAWVVTKFEFPGKSFLITLIDIPFSVSPVIAGFIYVIIFGAGSVLEPWLDSHDIEIVFAIPGIILATIFVTFPFIARQIMPLMMEQGKVEEEASLILGAGGLQTFFYVTLPNIKWALLYGVLLCNARAMGEFGAVSVISGHIRGYTNTMPLHIEVLYNEYNFIAAFSVASLLTLLALVTLVLKSFLERKSRFDSMVHFNP